MLMFAYRYLADREIREQTSQEFAALLECMAQLNVNRHEEKEC